MLYISKFPSHNGSDQTVIASIREPSDFSVSIPQWFGSNQKRRREGVFGKVSIPQWFGSNSMYLCNAFSLNMIRFHPTMVRIKRRR